MRLSLSEWESFYVITGTAGAALTGLMFVVIAASALLLAANAPLLPMARELAVVGPAAVSLLLLFIGIHNAWDVAVFLVIQRHTTPAALETQAEPSTPAAPVATPVAEPATTVNIEPSSAGQS